jgi:hypothetical protein
MPHSTETLAEDIRELAQKLLDDPSMMQIIRGAGPNGQLPLEGEIKLIAFCESEPFMQRFVTVRDFHKVGLQPNNNMYIAGRYNPYVAIAVARLVAQGKFASVNDEKATKLIAENKATGEVVLKETGFFADWRPLKLLSFDEYYEIVKQVWIDPEFQLALKAAIKAYADVKGDYHERQIWRPARNKLEDFPYRAMLQRGRVAKPVFWEPFLSLVDDKTDISNRDEFRKFIEKYTWDYIGIGDSK